MGHSMNGGGGEGLVFLLWGGDGDIRLPSGEVGKVKHAVIRFVAIEGETPELN